jgi:hypothetical protein
MSLVEDQTAPQTQHEPRSIQSPEEPADGARSFERRLEAVRVEAETGTVV